MFSSNTTQTSGGYEIQRSLRFNSADSAYLNRTPATASNRRTWTWSGWVKRSGFNADSALFTCFFASNDNSNFALLFNSANQLSVGLHSVFAFQTTPVYRDPSGWYHVVLAVDTTQATAANRMSLYVNGVQVTAFATNNLASIAQNTELGVNTANAHLLGAMNAVGWYYPGYMTEVNFIDGQALTPSSFGEINADTGVWQPKRYAGSYGTNGFYLNFSDNSNTTAATLGADYSGNGNNWTPNNFSVSAGAGNDSLVDSPTSYGTDTGVGGTVRGNYCTLNPLDLKVTTGSLSNGNLVFTGPTGNSAFNFVGGTIAISTDTTTGWYFEVTQTTAGLETAVSLLDTSFPASALNTLRTIGGTENASAGISYVNNGNLANYGSTSSGLTSWLSNNDVIGVAIKDNKIWFAKNGTWISGDPALGTSPTITLGTTKNVTPALTAINSGVCVMNFGQRPFAYTAPSGFKALNTQNLPTPTIGATPSTQAGKFFNPVLWTGDGGLSRSITGAGFQPDFVWMKARSRPYIHGLSNVVAGANRMLISNLTNAEVTDDPYGYTSAFNSDGFTITGGAVSNDTFNEFNATYVAWNWKANGAGVTNTAGSITSTVSANTTSGFSVVTFTTQSSGTATVGHGLGAAPSMIITKSRAATGNWATYHASLGNGQVIYLDVTNAAATSGAPWNNTSPSSTVFTLGTGFAAIGTMVAYCFAEVPGYSKFGSWTGNGSSDGPFVFFGFRPAYLLLKNTTTAGNSWHILDVARGTYNVQGPELRANEAVAESIFTVGDFVSNGFKLRDTNQAWNKSGDVYIFAAFASNPFKYSLAR